MKRCSCWGLPLMKVKRAENQRDQIQATNLAGPWERSFDGEEMPLLRSSINGGQTCREANEIRFKQQTLQDRWEGWLGDEEMPLLRSSIKEGQKCREAKEIRYTQQTLQGQTRREAKEIRFKQQTLQGPEEDHLTWRDAVAEVFRYWRSHVQDSKGVRF